MSQAATEGCRGRDCDLYIKVTNVCVSVGGCVLCEVV